MSTFATSAKGIDDDVKTDWKVHIYKSGGMEICNVKESYFQVIISKFMFNL